MKKTILISALCIGLFLFAGGYSHFEHRPRTGAEAPLLAVANADTTLRLDLSHGRYVLLDFWTSADAPSRKSVNVYTAWQRRHPDAPLSVAGINFDPSAALFHEIVRVDSLNPTEQFHASGDTARAIVRNYALRRGYGSVLINPEGVIECFNPTEEYLDSVFNINIRN